MPRGGTENNIAINTTHRTTGRIKFCFIRHVQWLTRTIKTSGSEHSDLSMDDVTQLFPQLSVGRRCWWQHLFLCHTFPTYGFLSLCYPTSTSCILCGPGRNAA